MLQALNYPAAAAKGLKRFIDNAKAQDSSGRYKVDINSCERLLDLLTFKSCIHFQLPEGGHIFNDNLRGIQGKPVRLPHPLISISYFVKDEPQGRTFDGSKMVYIPKRVVVAIELSRQELVGSVDSLFPGCERLCMVMAIFARGDFWTPCGSMVILPTDKWDGTGYVGEVTELPTFMAEAGGAEFLGKVKIMLPAFYNDIRRSHGDDYAARSAYHDIGGEAQAVLELCEALTCTNVHEAVIQPANHNLNVRRERDGKLPLWETRVLTIDVPKTKRPVKPWQGGHHATPKLHLCIGHIRSLPGGEGNIWINEYARGDPTKGGVRKSYIVRSNV